MDGTFSGDRVRQFREQQGLSRQALAERAGLSRAYIYLLEQGGESDGSRRPSYDVVFRLARALGVSAADLLAPSAPESAPPASMIAAMAPPSAMPRQSPRIPGIPPSLSEAAVRFDIPPDDVKELAQVRFRGSQPDDPLDWAQLWLALRNATRQE
jgi:transcriptional regulator with XRE-family HTH domain